MDSLAPGDHVSVAYATDDECRDLMVNYARRGVAAGHRVVVYLDTDAVDLARTLTAAVPDAALGQFAALRFGAGFGGSEFGVADMLDGLAALHEETRAAGYSALCVAGDMTWTRRARFSGADLVAYEAQANRLLGDGRIGGLCLYDRRRFPEGRLARIGAVHPGPLLRFTVADWGAQLRLTGEVDASNAGALPSILSLVSEADSAVLVDASELTFVDAAGASTLVRFAASRATRPTVVRCTRGVRQALRLVGADAVPSLVLRDRSARA